MTEQNSLPGLLTHGGPVGSRGAGRVLGLSTLRVFRSRHPELGASPLRVFRSRQQEKEREKPGTPSLDPEP